ncbi:MAG: YdjY domain-containing protein [Peptoniphilus sp.]|nr:YdjY domain-containing protein [Peptoniphilus sp.]MDY6045133.1 YdjY domain-containing protein [Peptoniphilus sp.]
MKKKFGLLTLALCLAFGLTACSSGSNGGESSESNAAPAAENTQNEQTTENAEDATAGAQEGAQASDVPTKENPLVIDKEHKAVKVYAEVNGKYKDKSTMHLVVSKSGKESNHAMFKSDAKALDFYDALDALGLKAGDNVTTDNAGKVQVEGDPLDVSFSFEGDDKAYDIAEIVDDSSGQPIDMRFGGNRDTQEKMNTGCISCLLSCPAGITSNHTHKLGDDDKESFTLTLNKENVPDDKTPVVVTFAAK